MGAPSALVATILVPWRFFWFGFAVSFISGRDFMRALFRERDEKIRDLKEKFDAVMKISEKERDALEKTLKFIV